MKITVVVAIIAVSALGGYILFSREEAEKWVEYSNDKFHYRIEYPSDWGKEIQRGGTMVKLNPDPPNRLIFVSVSSPFEGTLDEFLVKSISELQSIYIYENCTFSIENATLGDREGRVVVIENLFKSIDGEIYAILQKSYNCFIYVDGVKHPLSLLLTAKVGDDEAWNKIFPHVLESFEFV